MIAVIEALLQKLAKTLLRLISGVLDPIDVMPTLAYEDFAAGDVTV